MKILLPENMSCINHTSIYEREENIFERPNKFCSIKDNWEK